MAIGLVGTKSGMTRIYDEVGAAAAVTVIAVNPPNRVTQIKTQATDGYSAVQVTAEKQQKAKKVSKPLAGHFAKANVEAGKVLKEFRIDNEDLIALDRHASDVEQDDGKLRIGSEISVAIFSVGQKVDVTSVSKGKGYAGVVKRHNFSTQDATHGNSLSHRAPGSIGQNQSPRKVFKGKKMAGQMGNVVCTVQSQKIIAIDHERNLMMVEGTVPGAQRATVIVTPAVKAKLQEEKK
jgi:large subunit ribosomal protein L3